MSEFGTLHMEFAYLSDVTGNPAYKNAVERVRTAVQNAARPRKLYPNYLNPKTGKQYSGEIFTIELLLVHYSAF